MTESNIVIDIQIYWWTLTYHSESLFSFSIWILIFFLSTTSSSALPCHNKWQLHFSYYPHWKRWDHSTFKLSANFSVITCNIYIPHPDTLPLLSSCTFFFAWNSFPPDSHVGYPLTSLKSFFKRHLGRRSLPWWSYIKQQPVPLCLHHPYLTLPSLLHGSYPYLIQTHTNTQ